MTFGSIGRRMLGYCFYDDHELDYLAVREEYRHQHLAWEIMRQALRDLKGRGVNHVFGMLHKDNKPIQDFYARMESRQILPGIKVDFLGSYPGNADYYKYRIRGMARGFFDDEEEDDESSPAASVYDRVLEEKIADVLEHGAGLEKLQEYPGVRLAKFVDSRDAVSDINDAVSFIDTRLLTLMHFVHNIRHAQAPMLVVIFETQGAFVTYIWDKGPGFNLAMEKSFEQGVTGGIGLGQGLYFIKKDFVEYFGGAVEIATAGKTMKVARGPDGVALFTPVVLDGSAPAGTRVSAFLPKKEHTLSSPAVGNPVPIQVVKIAFPATWENAFTALTEKLSGLGLLKAVSFEHAVFDNQPVQRIIYAGGHLNACIDTSLAATVKVAALYGVKAEITIPLDLVYIGPEDFNGSRRQALALKRQYAEDLLSRLETVVVGNVLWDMTWDGASIRPLPRRGGASSSDEGRPQAVSSQDIAVKFYGTTEAMLENLAGEDASISSPSRLLDSIETLAKKEGPIFAGMNADEVIRILDDAAGLHSSGQAFLQFYADRLRMLPYDEMRLGAAYFITVFISAAAENDPSERLWLAGHAVFLKIKDELEGGKTCESLNEILNELAKVSVQHQAAQMRYRVLYDLFALDFELFGLLADKDDLRLYDHAQEAIDISKEIMRMQPPVDGDFLALVKKTANLYLKMIFGELAETTNVASYCIEVEKLFDLLERHGDKKDHEIPFLRSYYQLSIMLGGLRTMHDFFDADREAMARLRKKVRWYSRFSLETLLRIKDEMQAKYAQAGEAVIVRQAFLAMCQETSFVRQTIGTYGSLLAAVDFDVQAGTFGPQMPLSRLVRVVEDFSTILMLQGEYEKALPYLRFIVLHYDDALSMSENLLSNIIVFAVTDQEKTAGIFLRLWQENEALRKALLKFVFPAFADDPYGLALLGDIFRQTRSLELLEIVALKAGGISADTWAGVKDGARKTLEDYLKLNLKQAGTKKQFAQRAQARQALRHIYIPHSRRRTGD